MTETAPTDQNLQATLSRIEQRLIRLETQVARLDPLLARVAEAEETLPNIVATAGDTVDGWLAQLEGTGANAHVRVRAVGPLVERLSRPETVARMERLLDRLDVLAYLADSAVFHPPAVAVISQAGEALVETRKEPTEPMGLFAALGAIGRIDVQRALGFLVRFATHFGRRLAS